MTGEAHARAARRYAAASTPSAAEHDAAWIAGVARGDEREGEIRGEDGAELLDAPVVDEILDAGALAVGPIAVVAE